MAAAAKKRRSPEPEALLRDLAAFGEYPHTYAGALDAHRDFRAVFLGESTEEQGRRVLNQIMSWGRIMGATSDSDPIVMAIMNGERNAVLRIIKVIEVEPEKQPTQAVRR